MNENHTQRLLDVRARGPVHLPGFPVHSRQLPLTRDSRLSCLLISPSSLLHTGVTLVRKAKGAYSHADAGLKLSVIQPAAHQFSHLWKARARGPLPHSPLFLADINLRHCWLASSSWTELPSPFLCSDGCFSLDAPHHLPFIPAARPPSRLLHQAGPR